MQFRRLRQAPFKGKSTIIAEEILQMISKGNCKVGQKLPPERVIAEQMGVSRPSVREAISALQIGGILETRPGDGTYIVRATAKETRTPEILSILEESQSPYEIIQARKAVETGVLRLAIAGATEEDLQKIKQAWEEKSKKGRSEDFEGYTRFGKDFHLAIAQATGNTVIVRIMDSLLDVMHQPLWVSMRKAYYQEDPSRIEEMIAIHTDLVNAILERDTNKAIKALEEDLDHVERQMYPSHSDEG